MSICDRITARYWEEDKNATVWLFPAADALQALVMHVFLNFYFLEIWWCLHTLNHFHTYVTWWIPFCRPRKGPPDDKEMFNVMNTHSENPKSEEVHRGKVRECFDMKNIFVEGNIAKGEVREMR